MSQNKVEDVSRENSKFISFDVVNLSLSFPLKDKIKIAEKEIQKHHIFSEFRFVLV